MVGVRSKMLEEGCSCENCHYRDACEYVALAEDNLGRRYVCRAWAERSKT